MLDLVSQGGLDEHGLDAAAAACEVHAPFSAAPPASAAARSQQREVYANSWRDELAILLRRPAPTLHLLCTPLLCTPLCTAAPGSGG